MKRLLLALFVSCADEPPLAFCVSGFTDAERADIATAAAAWNARSNNPVTLDGGEWRIIKTVPKGGTAGWVSTRARLIKIHPEPGVPVYVVALHEFGHALGLGHTTTGVMMQYEVSDEFTDEVLAECRRVEACR